MSETSLVERKVNKSRMAGLVHGGADVVAVDLACRLDDLSPNILVVAAAVHARKTGPSRIDLCCWMRANEYPGSENRWQVGMANRGGRCCQLLTIEQSRIC